MDSKKAIQDSPKLSLYKETLKSRHKSTPKSATKPATLSTPRSGKSSKIATKAVIKADQYADASPEVFMPCTNHRAKDLNNNNMATPTQLSAHSTSVKDPYAISIKPTYQSDDNTPDGLPTKKFKPKTDISHSDNEAAKNTPVRALVTSDSISNTPQDRACGVPTPGSNDVNKETPKKSNTDGDCDGGMEDEVIRPLEAINLSIQEGEGEERGAKRRAEFAGGPTYKVCRVHRGKSCHV